MKTLRETVADCAARRQSVLERGAPLLEQNTKSVLIEPVIAALGWDVLDPHEVHREYQRVSTDKPVDYALLIDGTARLLIEAKRHDGRLDDPRWVNQTISYAAVAGVVWVALTNGAEWRIYNAHVPVPADRKLFKAVCLSDPDAVAVLSLLGKESVREARLDALWRPWHADRQVREVLERQLDELVKNPTTPGELMRLTEGVTEAELQASLVRVRASVRFGDSSPAVPSPPIDATPAPAPSPTVVEGVTRWTLARLVDAGRLKVGAELHATYRGRAVTAELGEEGRVLYAGTLYKSPSAAGRAVKRIVNPEVSDTGAQTDGWTFWTTKDPAKGDVVTLGVIRARATSSSASK